MTDALYRNIRALVPIECHGEHDAKLVLADSYERLKNILQASIASLDGNVLRDVKSLCDTVLECFDYAYSGNHTQAYNILSEHLKELSYLKPFVSEGESFYRMRLREDDKQFTCKDMMPIPDDKRYLVKTQRFSMPGLPCLYLGYHANACWEEMHRPSIGNCMISRYEVIKKFQVISLEIPTKEAFDADVDGYLRLFPLIMACMVKVADYKDPYKSAYLIPQLIMEWLTTYGGATIQDLKGVRYSSVHINDQFGYPQEAFNNLALPVPGVKSPVFAKPLSDLFMLTEPTCEEYERIKGNLDVGIVDIDEYQSAEGRYKYSMFGQLENNLKEAGEFPLEIM